MFTAKHNIQKKEKDLENTKEAVAEFKRKPSAEVRKQEKLDLTEKKDFRRGELLEKYIAKRLYEQNDKKFEKDYLKKLEKNW